MTPAEAASLAQELTAEFGYATTLNASASVQMDDGDVAETTTASPILFAPESDQELFEENQSKRVIEGYVSGARPMIGNTIILADGTEHRVDAVDTFSLKGIAVAWKVMLS